MLAQFSVENYMSIRDRAVLNLTASKSDNEHINNFVEYEKMRCLRSVVIYGANASGKSSLLKAMTAAIMIVRESQSMQIDGRIMRIVPFLFDEETPSKPSSFEFVIMIDGVRYVYGFSATQKAIIDEYLYVYHSAKPSMVFERSNSTNFKFNKADEREFSEYKKKTTENKLFLATATAWNCEKTKDVYMWFSKGIETYTDDNLNRMPFTLKQLKDSDTPELRQFTLKLLRNADINIDSYEIDAQYIDDLPKQIREMIGDSKAPGVAYNVMTGHTLQDNLASLAGCIENGFEAEGCEVDVHYNAYIGDATLSDAGEGEGLYNSLHLNTEN